VTSQSSFKEVLQKTARDFGEFEDFGFVDIELARSKFSNHTDRYRNWLDAGFFGEMQYLKRGLERRENLELLLPGARSVFAVLEPYSTRPLGGDVRFARYLREGDYHATLKSKLESFVAELKKSRPELRAKVCVDTSAVLERSWAALSGLGWIGKNTLLIHPQLGSYHFIGVVIFDQETGEAPALIKNYCGNCDRCLRACPTQAFIEPSLLDARKCISYLTLEYRGDIDASVNTGPWVAGCDVCQEVCPFNLKRVKLEGVDGAHRGDGTSIFELDPSALQSLTEDQYRSLVQRSSLSRVKYPAFRRNLSKIL
jgi:epoxyqueuosine reductase